MRLPLRLAREGDQYTPGDHGRLVDADGKSLLACRHGDYLSDEDLECDVEACEFVVRAANAFRPMLVALKEIEWSDSGYCPACGRDKRHAEDCSVGDAIAGAEAPRVKGCGFEPGAGGL